MSRNRLGVALACILVLAAPIALAGGTCPGTKSAEAAPSNAPALETAVFSVPGLADPVVVKNVTAVLAKQGGLVSAKPDAAAGTFLVTFECGKTNPDALGKSIAQVAPQAKLERVQPAEAGAAKHDCSKCPSKASCGKAK